MSGVSSAERVLANFARASHIPKDAEQWLLNAVDPCHDRLTKLSGYPDDNQSASVVQRVKQAFTIKSPTSITGNNLYDVMVLKTPFMNLNTLTNYIPLPVGGGTAGTIFSNTYTPSSAYSSLGQYGGLVFIAIPAGQNFTWANINANIASGAGYIISNALPATYSKGSSRIISEAFEVCNTTAELTVQGSVATFRQPIQDFEDAAAFQIIGESGNVLSSYTSGSCLPVPGPPVNLAQIMLLPGSRQWLAKEGVYCVGALNSDRLPVQDNNFTQPIIYQNGSDGSGAAVVGSVPSSSGVSWPGGGTVGIFNGNFWTNFDQYGALFSGLSATTTLQVSWIVDVERFPTEQQADLVVIATPSTVYSPTAIEAYSMIIQDMPTGVKFKENGLGEWFMDAVGSVRDVIMPTIRTAAKTNPAMGALVTVHDMITGKGKKNNKAKKDKAGAGFLAPSGGSDMKQGKPVGGKGKKPKQKYNNSLPAFATPKQMKQFEARAQKYRATGRKNPSAGKPNGYRPPVPPRTAKNGGIVKSSKSYNGGRVLIEEIE